MKLTTSISNALVSVFIFLLSIQLDMFDPVNNVDWWKKLEHRVKNEINEMYVLNWEILSDLTMKFKINNPEIMAVLEQS